jgi:hypothetical protein
MYRSCVPGFPKEYDGALASVSKQPHLYDPPGWLGEQPGCGTAEPLGDLSFPSAASTYGNHVILSAGDGTVVHDPHRQRNSPASRRERWCVSGD